MAISATAREGAGTIAQKAQVAGRIAQAGVRKRQLAKRVHVAESHLARSVMEKAEQGVFSSVDLADPMRELSDVDMALQAQKEEIARLRHELTESGRGGNGSEAGDESTPSVADPAAEVAGTKS